METKLNRYLGVIGFAACGYVLFFKVLFPTPPDLTGLNHFIESREVGEKLEVRFFQGTPAHIDSISVIRKRLTENVLACLRGELKPYRSRVGYRAMEFIFDNDLEYSLGVYRGQHNEFYIRRHTQGTDNISYFYNETMVIECKALLPLWSEVEKKSIQRRLN